MGSSIVDKIVEKVDFKIHQGMIADIDAFFESEVLVDAREVSYAVSENNRFDIFVVLNNYSRRSVQRIFRSFSDDIEYPGFKLHERKVNQDSICYTVITIKDEILNFYCTITFKPSDDKGEAV